jgi:uracil-DNA glycosylase
MEILSAVGSWDRFLNNILYDPVVLHNLNTINSYYKNNDKIIYPLQENVFKAFKECPYDKLSVVILLQDPYHDGSATGIAMGNETQSRISPSLRIVWNTILRTVYKGGSTLDHEFDSTLISWANQGILLLNTALTVEQSKPLSHQKLWSYFTERVLIKLSSTNSGLIYCLWGKHAQSFSMYINGVSNTILTCEHPVASAYKGVPWDCDNFNTINALLKSSNNLTINW